MSVQNKKAIVLYGNGCTGKTTTLKLLIDKLKSVSNLIKEKQFYNRKHEETDKWAVFDYNGKSIAVVTGGDSKSAIEWYLNDIENLGIDIDIYILACRSKGQSVDYIEDVFSYVLWERRWNISEENLTSGLIDDFRNEASKLQADTIIKTIDRI